MKTFKKFVNEKFDPDFFDKAYSLDFNYPKEVKAIFNNLITNKDITDEDINLLITKYRNYNYFRTVAEFFVSIDKKIPNRLVKHFDDHLGTLGLFVMNVQRLPDYKEKLKGILQRNPELIADFI